MAHSWFGLDSRAFLTELPTKGGFWLIVISVAVMIAERVRPWRKQQPMLRPLLLQDLLWFALNTYLLATFAGPAFDLISGLLASAFHAVIGVSLDRINLLSEMPVLAQAAIGLVLIDLVEWCVHNLLHRAPWLWRIHRVHHSIHDMDWIGNFRFHPLELLVYHFFKYLPMGLLGASGRAYVVIGAFSLLIGTLNHSNLDISWGPGRYVLNSPRMHLWHHEARVRGSSGVNFGIVLSLWDWLFRTAHMPPDEVPEQIGFEGDERFPKSFWWRLFLPFADR